jgi:20S proteasome subunit alpha 5
MSFERAEMLALEILKQVMEEKISASNVEVASVRIDSKFHVYTKDEVQAILSRL